ncbi:hypothetical protein TSUD_267160 [Trifolium subterraneum]|uniref:Uncharacterized protein n=1 Tax=Trifolium subterraneum TaxID=3900 RepID=A0A2Z6M3A9_TRISU|nr:hypothetical protein TSUD_267160 [Trifolium subterraneum]
MLPPPTGPETLIAYWAITKEHIKPIMITPCDILRFSHMSSPQRGDAVKPPLGTFPCFPGHVPRCSPSFLGEFNHSIKGAS